MLRSLIWAAGCFDIHGSQILRADLWCHQLDLRSGPLKHLQVWCRRLCLFWECHFSSTLAGYLCKDEGWAFRLCRCYHWVRVYQRRQLLAESTIFLRLLRPPRQSGSCSLLIVAGWAHPYLMLSTAERSWRCEALSSWRPLRMLRWQ